MSDPSVLAPTAPSPILLDLLALNVPRLSSDGSAIIRPDGSVFAQIVLNPKASPVAGTYGPSQSVVLSCDTAGAAIYYTTNGDTPTTSSTLYSAPIALTNPATTTIKAIAVVAGQLTSPVMAAAFTITNGRVATPSFTPAAGAVASGTTIALASATAGATIYYTVDGSTPTAASPTYSTPIEVTAPVTIKALAVKSGYADSAVGSAAYTVA